MPDKAVLPEWIDTGQALSEKTAKKQAALFDLFSTYPAEWLFYLGFHESDPELSLSLNYFLSFAALFVRKLSRIPELEALRHMVTIDISEEEVNDFLGGLPLMTGSEYIDRKLLLTLWSGYQEAFSSAIQKHPGPISSFFSALNPDIHLAGRVFFHMVENREGGAPFAFMATYSSGMGANGKPRHLPLKHALSEYDTDQPKLIGLLSTVYAAAEKSRIVREMIGSGELFHPLAWGPREAFQFLKEVPLYEDAGVLCRIPNWWKKTYKSASVRISLGGKKPAHVGMKALVDFRADILLGDTPISIEEARRLIEEAEGLALLKNRWVPVDPEKLKMAIQACEAANALNREGISLRDAMRFKLSPETLLELPGDDLDLSITNGAWLQSVMEKLKEPDRSPDISPGKGFLAHLRPYQKEGLRWLSLLDSLCFGACLADDMGLGKTVQLLAFLNRVKGRKPEKASLLVVPASLISNWISELERFSPTLTFMVAHPGFIRGDTSDGNENGSSFPNPTDIDRHDLIITTYALVQKHPWIAEHAWRYVILDEAQAIKNPGTRQTKAVKKLKSENRIIMTGTPVENRLSDLWSLFDFLNQGLLGNQTEFSRFAKSLAQRPSNYAHLRQLVSPFILRRLKTDKSVISDLPEKVEMKTFADLSKKQIVLYHKAVADLEKIITESDETGIKRKGVILSFLMKFKQLCNHPDQLTGAGAFREEESGKFMRLREIAETIHEKRERMILFTQFQEMTEPLRSFLETIFNAPGLVLHGSVPVGKRKPIIEAFQQEAYSPFMVLSLKAGGVGLNLTKANHVVHFDRWWNPAVEDQATDRAFRIGQKKNVMVHKFVTKGTVEEKIDLMLHDKKELSDRVIAPTGEALITELDNKALLNLFRLKL